MANLGQCWVKGQKKSPQALIFLQGVAGVILFELPANIT